MIGPESLFGGDVHVDLVDVSPELSEPDCEFNPIRVDVIGNIGGSRTDNFFGCFGAAEQLGSDDSLGQKRRTPDKQENRHK